MKRVLLIAFCTISIFTSKAQRIFLVAGGPGDGGLATNADVYPGDIAAGQDGTVYVVSQMHYTVKKIDPVSNILTRIVGTGANGSSDLVSNALNSPASVFNIIAIGPGGELYYDDGVKIRMLRSDGNGVVVAGASFGFGGDGGLAVNASFSTLSDVCLDAAGNIYIADFGNARIRKVDAITGIITTIAGNGSGTPSGNGGLAINAGMAPQRLVLDGNGNLYFSEIPSNSVRKINLATGAIDVFAGTGSSGLSGDGGQATSAALNFPVGLVIDGDKMYIADSQNGRIRQVMISTGVISTIAGTTPGFSGDGGPAVNAKLRFPSWLALDGSHNLYISEFDGHIRKITGTTITTIGGNASYGGDGGPANLSSVNSPMGIVQTQNGDIFFSDELNHRIRKIDHTTGIISTFAGTGVSGYSGDGGQASAAMIYRPHGLALDPSGNILFCDKINCRIRKIDVVTGIISTVAGNGVLGDTGNGGLAVNAQLFTPIGIAIDVVGNIFFTDASHKVKKIDHATSILTTLAGTGSANFSGDGGPAVSAELNSPEGLAVDAAGSVYIADKINFRVRKVDVAGVISTVAGAPGDGFITDGTLATQASIGIPSGVSIDTNGDLLFNGNDQLVRLEMATGKVYKIVGGNGSGGYAGDGGPAKGAILQTIGFMVRGVDKNIYLTDPSNHTVRKIVPAAVQTITFTAPSAHTFGDAAFTLTASSSASLPITFTSSNSAIATISGDALTIRGGGTVDITASQAGNIDYLPATPVVRSLQINPKAQSITFEVLTPHGAGDVFTAFAVSSSGLPVAFTSSNTEIASVSGNIITLKSAGTVDIIANQAGNSNYLSAAPVTQTLAVSAVTGIDETSGISIYPNPARDQIILDIGSAAGNKTEVAIFDILGQPVTELVVVNGSHRLDVSTWHAGIYIIRIKGTQGVISRSFIKAQ